MRRVGLCIAIIAGIITISVISLFILSKNNKEVFAKINEITRLYDEDSDEVPQKIEELEDYWEKYYIRISFVAQSSTLDDISYSVAKLGSLYDQESDEFISECESIKYWVGRVYDSQFPHFYSVF